jgi:hypothetical protein
VPEDVFAWAASLPTEHTCEWVVHPTEEERREATEKLVWKRLWYCPFIRVQKIVNSGLNRGQVTPYEECAICDVRRRFHGTQAPNELRTSGQHTLAEACVFE